MSQSNEDRIQEIYAYLMVCRSNLEVLNEQITIADGRLKDLKDQRDRERSSINEWHDELRSIFRMGDADTETF